MFSLLTALRPSFSFSFSLSLSLSAAFDLFSLLASIAPMPQNRIGAIISLKPLSIRGRRQGEMHTTFCIRPGFSAWSVSPMRADTALPMNTTGCFWPTEALRAESCLSLSMSLVIELVTGVAVVTVRRLLLLRSLGVPGRDWEWPCPGIWGGEREKELPALSSIRCFVGDSTAVLVFVSMLLFRLLLVRNECLLFATTPAVSVNIVVSASFSASFSASNSPSRDWELLLWWLWFDFHVSSCNRYLLYYSLFIIDMIVIIYFYVDLDSSKESNIIISYKRANSSREKMRSVVRCTMKGGGVWKGRDWWRRRQRGSRRRRGGRKKKRRWWWWWWVNKAEG